MTAKNARRPKGEGSIFQRADGKWIGRITYDDPETGLRKRSQVSGDTPKAAAAALKKIRERVDAKQPPRDDRAMFGAFAEQWISTSLAVSDRKQSTKTLYAGLTRSHIVGSALGMTPMNQIRATTVERFITQLRAKGLSESTVRQIYTVARGIGDAAVRDRLITENAFGQVKRPEVEHKEAPVLTVEEARRLVTEAGASRYAVLFELLVNTGMRRGEALALKWSDVDIEGRTARVRRRLFGRVASWCALPRSRRSRIGPSSCRRPPWMCCGGSSGAMRRTVSERAACGTRRATCSSRSSGSPATLATR